MTDRKRGFFVFEITKMLYLSQPNEQIEFKAEFISSLQFNEDIGEMEIRSPGYESYVAVKRYTQPYVYLVDIRNKFNPLILRRFGPSESHLVDLFQPGRGLAYNRNYILCNLESTHDKSTVWFVYDIHSPNKLMPLKVLAEYDTVSALLWHEDYFLFKSKSQFTIASLQHVVLSISSRSIA